MSATNVPRESLKTPIEPLVSLRKLLRDSQNGLAKRHGDNGEPVPVLRLANVVDGAIDESDAREIRLTEKEIAKYALESDDLLCIRVNGSRNLVGRVVPFVARRRWAYCDHFIRLRPDHSRVDSRYLAHYLDTRVARRQIALTMVSSAGQNTVSQGTMLDLLVPLPNLTKQRAIVAEIEKQFSRLDEAVANLKRVKANLKRYKAAVLQSAVDGRILFSDVSANADSPSKWDWATCGDVIESIQAGASFKCLERPPMDGEVGVVKVSAVTWGEFDEFASKTCLDPERVREALFIRPGDFLFSRANTIDLVGACVIAKTVTKSLMLSDKILRSP